MKDILIKNIRRKNKVNEIIKTVKEEGEFSTVLDIELLKTILETNKTHDFSSDLILGEIEIDPHQKFKIIENFFGQLDNRNPFIKKKKFSMSNILNISNQFSESSFTLKKTLKILINKDDSQTRPLSPFIHQRNKEQLYDSKIISSIQTQNDKKYDKTFEILQDNNQSVSRILNLSQIDAFNMNDDKTKDEEIHKNLIKKIIINKKVPQKKNKKENLNRHISNQFSISKRSPSRGLQGICKQYGPSSTTIQEAINIYRKHHNSKNQINNKMPIVDFKSHLQDNIIPPLFKKSVNKPQQNQKVEIIRHLKSSKKSVSSSKRIINTKKDLFRTSKSNQNLQFNNVVNFQTNKENNFNSNLSSRKEQIPVTINIIENSSCGLNNERTEIFEKPSNYIQYNELNEKVQFTGEKERQPIYNISVNVNLNVSVTNNFSKSNNKKCLSPKNINPISPYTTKNSHKVKIFDSAIQVENSSTAAVLPLKKEEIFNNENLTTQMASMSHRAIFSAKYKNFQNTFKSKINKEFEATASQASNKVLTKTVNPTISNNSGYYENYKQPKNIPSKSIERLYRGAKPVKLNLQNISPPFQLSNIKDNSKSNFKHSNFVFPINSTIIKLNSAKKGSNKSQRSFGESCYIKTDDYKMSPITIDQVTPFRKPRLKENNDNFKNKQILYTNRKTTSTLEK